MFSGELRHPLRDKLEFGVAWVQGDPAVKVIISKEPGLVLHINLIDLLMCSWLQAWPKPPAACPRST
jgi:hypothetical protein